MKIYKEGKYTVIDGDGGIYLRKNNESWVIFPEKINKVKNICVTNWNVVIIKNTFKSKFIQTKRVLRYIWVK